MSRESAHIDALRALATHPAARGLKDDVAVLGDLILTHDMMAEGVHWLPGADPADVAWKLLASNLSDLAAKGAEPLGVLLGQALGGDAAWDAAFVAGLGLALAHFNVPLLGGDTITLPDKSGRVVGMTAIGKATHVPVPARCGARAGDLLWVTGPIGNAGAGLELLRAGTDGGTALKTAHQRPVPLLQEGRALAPLVTAMMDVSDGLLIDAARMADASGLSLAIDLDAVPLSNDFVALRGTDRNARLFAATAGDDYALLFALPLDAVSPVAAHRIGTFATGQGMSLFDADGPVPLPPSLGYQH